MKTLISILLFTAGAFAQMSPVDTLPGTCTVGQTFVLTTAAAGQNIYICTSTNTLQVAGSGTPAVSNVTPVTVSANVTSAQVLQQLSLPAGLLNSAGAPYTYNGSGIYTAASLQTPTLTWTLNLCTVSGCGSGTVRALATIVTPAVVTATNNVWNIRLVMSNTATGATGTLIAHGSAIVELTAASDLGTASSDSNTASSGTINLTAALFLQLTVTTSTGNTGNSITEDHSSLEPASATGPAGPAYTAFTSAQNQGTDVICAKGSDTITGLTCNNSADGTSVTPFTTSVSIPAGTLTAGTSVPVTLVFGSFATTTVPTAIISLKLGGTTIYTQPTTVTGTNAAPAAFAFRFVLTPLTAASTSTPIVAAAIATAGSSTNRNNLITNTNLSVTVNTTITQTLTVSVQFGANTVGNAIWLYSISPN